MSGWPPDAVAEAFRAACRAELQALKPGNVHVHADGHAMTVADFLASAEASAPHIADPHLPVGRRIEAAVAATRAAVGQNTNLGILLLAAPLAAAAQAGGDLAQSLARVLAGLTVEDAAACYRAIRLAAPGGLGRSGRHDVADEPTIMLRAAMQEAAERDLIARQYANGFADVLGLGVGRLAEGGARGWREPWAVGSAFLGFLGRFPDSHIVRRHGAEVAERVRLKAAALDRDLLAAAEPAERTAALLAFDAELKRDGINPGTGADLTVASCLAASLLAY